GLGRGDARSRAPRAAEARRPRRHGGHGRRRQAHAQHLDGGGARRCGRRRRRREARQPRRLVADGLGRRARGARLQPRPRTRPDRRLDRQPGLRLHVRAGASPRDATCGAGPQRARNAYGVQRARPAHESRPRAGAGRRRLLGGARAPDRGSPRAARVAPGLRGARRRRHRRALADRAEPRVRGGGRRCSRTHHRPGGARRRALRPRRARRRGARGERGVDPPRVRRRGQRPANCDPPERRRRDRRRRPRRGSARGDRARTRGDRLRCRTRAARRAGGVLQVMRFADALARPGLGAIAEVKRRSPSAGDLRPDADPAQLAAQFANAGAAAISVLVDERFGGTIDDLRAARAATEAPLLGKGFFSTEEELRELREAGADAVLLLLRDLDDVTAARLLAYVHELGMDALVEAHDADELQRAMQLDAPVVGINARDLSTFDIDRRTQLELVARAPRDRIVIAESGVHTRAQGAAAELAGADAILVGSSLMRAADPPAKLKELLSRPLVKVCGLTRQEDVDVAVDAGADLLGFIFVEKSPRRAPALLDVPDTTLSVAVFVEDTAETPADLVQF